MSPSVPSTPNAGWLDEELRKQKAIIAELRENNDKQQVTIVDQNQRIVSLEDRLAKLQAQLMRIPEVEEALRHNRDELVLMISELRQDQQKRGAELLRNRLAEREQDLRSLQQIEAQMQRFEPLEQSMTVRQAEERRLHEMIQRLQQALDDVTRRLAQRDEVGRQLSDRIEQTWVRVAQVELSVTDEQKRIQEHTTRLLVAEDDISKLSQQITGLQAVRDELTKQQEELAETQRRGDRERAQTLAEWGRRLEAYAHQLDVWGDQLRYFTDQNEKSRRTLREIQELAHQVSQQQDQMRQLQRIAEEQLRREFAEWRNAMDRRWAQEAERREAASVAQKGTDDVQDNRLGALEEKSDKHLDTINRLTERIDQTRAEFLAEFERVRRAQLRVLHMETKAFQEVLAEIKGFLGEEDS